MSSTTPALGPRDMRAAVALAEALLPGSLRVPPADEATVHRAMDVLHELPAPARWAFTASARLLDAAPLPSTGKRFRALDRATQEELLRAWPSSPVLSAPLTAVSQLFKMCHFDSDEVYRGLGGEWNTAQKEHPPWHAQVRDAADVDESTIECDVVVVGTGAGGAVVGKELAAKGHAVVFVEAGKHHARDEFDGRSIDAHLKFYRPALTLGNAPMPLMMGRMLGGSTAINGGSCYRTPNHVLDRWCEDLDSDELSVERMKPFFERVETTLEVAPAPRSTNGPIEDVVARGCDALGYEHFRVQRNAPGCDGKGFCDFGCRTGARRSTDLSYVPLAAQHGALVLTGLRATRVIVEGGRAVGLETALCDGERTIEIRASRVVLACGAVQTPAFMLRQGLANESGEVGRHLAIQPSSGLAALMPERIDGPRHTPQGYGVSEFLREGILIAGGLPDYNFAASIFALHGRRLMDAVDGIENMAAFALLSCDTSQPGRVRVGPGGHPIVSYNVAADDVARMHRASVLAGEICLAAGARRLYPQVPSMPILENADELAAFREAKLSASDFHWVAYHPLGSCRMGADPRTSVVDLAHECHGVPGLHIVDGSTVPGPLGVNPQITIMAMATRAAGLIDGRLD